MKSVIKKFILVGIIMISTGITYKVTCYTYANVESKLEFAINSSDNALIALPEDINIFVTKVLSVTKTIKDLDEKDDTNPEVLKNIDDFSNNKVKNKANMTTEYFIDKKENCIVEQITTISIEKVSSNFFIKNNMNKSIIINIDSSPFGIENNGEFRISKNKTLYPGETLEIPFHIDETIENQNFDISVSAYWDGGSVEINKKVNIIVETNIVEVEPINMRTKALDHIDMNKVLSSSEIEKNIDPKSIKKSEDLITVVEENTKEIE